MDEHRYAQLARATESLRDWLMPLEFTDRSRSAVTEAVTAQAVAWAEHHGFEVRQQVEAIASQRRPLRQIGFLDIAGERASGQKIAIEVVFTNKVWSIEKLATEADAGKLALWIKWGGPLTLSLIPEKIGIIELEASSSNIAGHTMYRRQAHAFFPREPAHVVDTRSIASTL